MFKWMGNVGRMGALYPVSLLALLLPCLALFILAWRKKAKPAAAILLISCLSLLYASIYPLLSQGNRARHYGVRPELRQLFRFSPNIGAYEKARTTVYTRYPDEPAIFLDIWQPSVPTKALRPAIVKIHGGEWVEGSRMEMTGWSQWLSELGYVVFDIDFRMPPAGRWKEEIGDVKAALAWVKERAEVYSIDTNRIAAMGFSSGANLALLAAYTYNHPELMPSFGRPAVPVRCVIDLYGPVDLVTLFHLTGRPGTIRPRMKQYLGGTPSHFPERYRLLSPVQHVRKHSPPTLILHGESDGVCPAAQSRLLEETLRLHGVPNTCYYLPYGLHGFDEAWNSIGSQIAREKIRSFLQRYNSAKL